MNISSGVISSSSANFVKVLSVYFKQRIEEDSYGNMAIMSFVFVGTSSPIFGGLWCFSLFWAWKSTQNIPYHCTSMIHHPGIWSKSSPWSNCSEKWVTAATTERLQRQLSDCSDNWATAVTTERLQRQLRGCSDNWVTAATTEWLQRQLSDCSDNWVTAATTEGLHCTCVWTTVWVGRNDNCMSWVMTSMRDGEGGKGCV